MELRLLLFIPASDGGGSGGKGSKVQLHLRET